MKYFCISLIMVSSVFAQRTPLKVNNTVINNPNFTNTTSLTYSVASGRVSAILRTNLDIPFLTTANFTNNQVTLPSINLGSGTSFPIDPLASSSYLGTASGDFTVTIATNILTDATNEINVYLYLLDSVGGRIGTFTGFTPRGYVGTNVVGTNIYWLQRVGGSWFVQQNTAYIDPALFPPSGVTAGVYGDGNYIPQITVDDKGIVTSVTTNAIASGAGGGNVVNTGASQIRNIPAYTDTSGTNVAPAAGITMTGVNNTNVWDITAGSVTGSGTNNLFNFNATLNTSGHVDMWRFALTDTASAATTRFLWMGLASGSSIFSVSKGGIVLASSSILSGGNNTGAGSISSAGVNIINRGTLAASADGVFRLQDSVGTGFTSFQLGPTDSAANTSSILGSGGSGTDIAGGLINLTGGASTGTGRGGAVVINTTPSGSTGTSANSASVRAYYSAKNVTLTEGADTVFANITVPTSGFVGATLSCTVFSGDGTDFQSLTSNLRVDAVNKAGTVTAAITQTDNTAAVSAGTLSCAYTAVALGASVSIRANPNSSFASPTALHVTWVITGLNSAGSPAVTAQ